jgi:phage tail sheath protein FI
MANSNRVFVSPGVYTSEKDLTFVAQSVGVTTLGIVGETLKGPAFEPILVSNFDEFKTYFGQTSPEKDGDNNPKYELPYIAKSYLQESNQLFVTRILGLSGYLPNKTFGIKALAATGTSYNDVIVASLRSRGSYNASQVLVLEVTGNTSVTISTTGVTANPLAEFTLNVTGATGGAKSFTVSMDPTSTKYISKVLGTTNTDKSKSDFPLYVDETYPNYLNNMYKQGNITGLSTTLVYNAEGNAYKTQWDTAASPTVVSEVRGGQVDDLFQVLTISDGDSSNEQIKVTIQNINLETGEFDVIVRDFNDTDDNQVVLEKFSRCSMNPEINGYVARKIGTSDGEYELRSKFIMLSMTNNHPTDAFPAGFKGFTAKTMSGDTTLGNVTYKTEYFNAGDTIYSGASFSGTTASEDKVKKVCLGLSSQDGFKYDADLFRFKGTTGNTVTSGFHLSTNASSITGTTYETTSYDLEGNSKGKLENIAYRKFTFAVCGGFDGWDIYRDTRTLGDSYILGKSTYTSGSTSNGGVFSTSTGNSDYYAYYNGIQTFANPEAIDINVFATAGINWNDHSSLTSQAIDMVENDRADSMYIMSSPRFSGETATSVADALDTVSFDSNYSATYWPWIQVRDTDNATQLYIPPTGEVLKNIALTDNVSYPWFAVAGYQRGLVNAIKADKKLTLDERDDLYKGRINPIATFSDTGTIIWGNKTLQVRESALDRINVRRLLLRARKLISAVAVRLLFEQNDEQVRQEFLRLVNPILESIKKERGLYEFKVTVSNDPEDIDANTLRGKIYVKPTRSLEFIDLEFVITPTGASFENI